MVVFNDVVDMIIGVVNGTYPQEASEIDDCRAALEERWYEEANMVALYIDQFEYFEAVYGICLLYTSPSPRDLSTSRMPSSA